MRNALLLGLLSLALFSQCKKSPDPAPVTPADSTHMPIDSVVPVDTTHHDTIPQPVVLGFAKGADISWLTEMEAANRRFKDTTGAYKDLLAVLKAYSLDAVRLRVWVNPANAYNGAQDVLAKALRAKAAGMRVMVDFHYSDTWADPGNQTKPAAWASYTPAQLKGAVYQHTYTVLSLLKTNGVQVEWAQVGNETRDGMLWPEGRASAHMADFAQMVDTGYAAVKAVDTATKVIVHVDNGHENFRFRFIFDGLRTYRARYDVIGMSLYPSLGSGGWQTYVNSYIANCTDVIARYGRPVMAVEIGMPVSPVEDSRQFISAMVTRTRAIPDHMGQGVFYWEPEAYNWQGYGLGAWLGNGLPSPAMRGFLD